MSSRFIWVLVVTISVYCALARNEEPTAPPENTLLASIIRTREPSTTSRPDGKVEEPDKRPRTANNRLETKSKDKLNILIKIPFGGEFSSYVELKCASSSCCGSRYSSGSSTRPDWYGNRRPDYSNKGSRFPPDRYAWQTQGQPPGSTGSTGRPGTWSSETFLEASYIGDGFNPSYGNEGTRKPSGYSYGTSGGYGYGNNGGYGFNRPTGYGGISGTLASGDEFESVEPNYPETNVPKRPNIQTQKAVALKALAGVALIATAAALATNPVLLPLGAVSGRRRRSVSDAENKDEDILDNLIRRRTIEKNFIKVPE